MLISYVPGIVLGSFRKWYISFREVLVMVEDIMFIYDMI